MFRYIVCSFVWRFAGPWAEANAVCAALAWKGLGTPVFDCYLAQSLRG